MTLDRHAQSGESLLAKCHSPPRHVILHTISQLENLPEKVFYFVIFFFEWNLQIENK